MRWDQEADILVFGSGAAGMSAALAGAIEGFDVLLCEKLERLGGTTATSAGTASIPGSNQSRRDGVPDDPDKGRSYLAGEIGPSLRKDLFDAFLRSGPEAIDYLEAHSQVVFDAIRDHPDYHPERPGAARSGRALGPRPFDGRLLGRDFGLIRPPRDTLMIFGGMMVGRREVPDLLRPFSSPGAFAHVVSILSRHATDRLRYPRGTRLILGNALVARFLASLRQRNVAITVRTRLVELVREAGRVSGAVVELDGRRRSIRARRAVILATGGFAGSERWRAELMDGYPGLHCYAFEDSSGDALASACEVGGVVDAEQISPGWFTPVSIWRRRDGSESLWAHHSLDRAKPGLVAVNSAGKRFVNEGVSYHDFVLAMLDSNRQTPTVPAHLICDRAFLRRYGLGLVRPIYQRSRAWVDAGYLARAATLPDLARRIGVDVSGLEETVRHNNRFADKGVDEDFGKGADGLSRHSGDPSHRPNPCIGPIRQPPFFAVSVYPGIIGTSVGLRTDCDGAVLDETGSVIDGLFAVGNDMASVMRGAYPGPGITLGPAITFAYLAIMRIKRGEAPLEHAVPRGSHHRSR